MNLAGLTVVDMDWFGFMLGIVSLDEFGENISCFSFGFTAVDSFKVVIMEGSVLMSSWADILCFNVGDVDVDDPASFSGMAVAVECFKLDDMPSFFV